MITLTAERRRTLKSVLHQGQSAYRLAAKSAAVIKGRLLGITPLSLGFRGAYATYDAAMAAVPRDTLAGYNHEDIADISFDVMCKIAPWDYPVLYWLDRLLRGEGGRLLDAGGHMGTKYRAFSNYLDLGPSVDWIIYDLPAIVQAGRRRAENDNLESLIFTDQLDDVGRIDILLASGLLQYLDIPFSQLVGQLAVRPQHILINKLAVRDGATVVTLENFGRALVPYQIRSQMAFFEEIDQLGYRIVDTWDIPSLSHTITTHPELGASRSMGLYLEAK
ncbi:MAG: TIGR04325 family methyltransferase [Hyphomicrobiaceae bacterium]